MSFPSIRFLFIRIGTAHAHSNLDPHSSKSQHNQNSQLTWFIRFHFFCSVTIRKKETTQSNRFQLQAILPPFVFGGTCRPFRVEFSIFTFRYFFFFSTSKNVRLLIWKYKTGVGVDYILSISQVHSSSWMASGNYFSIVEQKTLIFL
jgi:hypothetical protein